MITADGQKKIKRYLAQLEPSIADAIGVGISGEASPPNGAMGFELDHTLIAVTSYDFNGDVIVVKGSLDTDLEGVIYEMSLLGSLSDHSTSDTLTTFDSDSEDWSAGTFASDFTRIGADSLRLSPGALTTLEAQLDVFLDLSPNSNSDQFVLAFNSLNANTSSIQVTFYVDGGNYYRTTISSPATGYNFTRVNKGDFVVTGVPDWSNISTIGVGATAGASGAAQVDFDGLRIQAVMSADPDYILIARDTLGIPYTKVAGKAQDVEYSIPVSFA